MQDMIQISNTPALEILSAHDEEMYPNDFT